MEKKEGSILLFNPEEDILYHLIKKLEKTYDIFLAASEKEVKEILRMKSIELILVNHDGCGENGFNLMNIIDHHGLREIHIIGKKKTVKTVIQSIHYPAEVKREGRCRIESIAHEIRRFFENRGIENDREVLTEKSEKYYIFENMVGNDNKIRRVFELVTLFSQRDGTVLVQGESGTGKELVAKAIHHRSQRRNGPFVVINCAAIPQTLMEKELFGFTRGAFTGAFQSSSGKLEIANNGSVFLDDIDSLDISMQAKLLRVIQEKEFERLGSTRTVNVNVRFIAATNKNLMELVRHGLFRDDLYYRLNVLPISLPALRERKNDIELLLTYFLRLNAESTDKSPKRFSENAIKIMTEYDWPGNIRELQNLVEHLFVVTKGYVIDLKDLPSSLRNGSQHTGQTLKDALAVNERAFIVNSLETSEGNRQIAARKLGIHRNTLLNKMKAFEIKI